LCELLLNPSAPTERRRAAAGELAASIRCFGQSLTPSQVTALVTLYDDPAGQRFRPALAAVIGALQPKPEAVARRLLDYRPPLQPPSPTTAPAESPASKPVAPAPTPRPSRP